MTNHNYMPAKREPPAGPPQPVVQSPSGQHLAQYVANNPLLPRIHLAMMFPRDVAAFDAAFRAEVLRAPEGMVYAKPQGNEKLRGPSIRMAEVAVRNFRNLWISEPRIEERDSRVTVTVEVLDLESNCSQPGTASTSLVGKDRKRLREDIVSNLVSATVAKAKRNAIIAIIGRTFFDTLVGLCVVEERKRAREWSPEQRLKEWAKAAAWWTAKAGVGEAELLRFCRANSPAEVASEALIELREAHAAVQQGVPARVALGLEDAVETPGPAPAAEEDDFPA